MNALIYGQDETQRVVSVEVSDGVATIYRELEDGSVVSEERPHNYWILYADNLNPKFERLRGDANYRYLISYSEYERYREIVSASYRKRYDFYTAHDPKTNFMLRSGLTYFKGMKVEEVSVLSFDIETTGLNPKAPDAQVLLITNTYRVNGKVKCALFCVDDYETDYHMITEWCKWVQQINPSIIIGHNVLGFDFPYLNERGGGLLRLGRDGSNLEIQERVRQFRKDGSQSYDFHDVLIHGREIIDTKFLAIKYDVKREFPNYSLKSIIAHLGLEKKGRTFIDASRMKELWANPEMRKTIKVYAAEDADDALMLYDKFIPAFFYYTQHIPRSFQQINNTATGGQIDDFMTRAYLQEGHSIPKASEASGYEGAISFGRPGIHKNVFKIDVASMYPSIMLGFGISPGPEKDPKGYFQQMLDFFTKQRLANKRKAEESSERLYSDLSEAQKIVINSGYGFLGAPGCRFNNPAAAAEVTRIGRAILMNSIYYATGKEFQYAGTESPDDTSEDNFHA